MSTINQGRLEWHGDHGFFPVNDDGVYNEAYFDKYVGYARTELGVKLTEKRVELVDQFAGPSTMVLDFGIGCGHFVETRNRKERRTLGYDVCPKGINWLRERDLFCNPYLGGPHEAVTFWDSLEHVVDPAALMDRCSGFVFISMPIFLDRDHVLRSKHFRPDEHYWYFTRAGLIYFMDREGFQILHRNEMETELGREDIETFVFRRRGEWELPK